MVNPSIATGISSILAGRLGSHKGLRSPAPGYSMILDRPLKDGSISRVLRMARCASGKKPLASYALPRAYHAPALRGSSSTTRSRSAVALVKYRCSNSTSACSRSVGSCTTSTISGAGGGVGVAGFGAFFFGWTFFGVDPSGSVTITPLA